MRITLKRRSAKLAAKRKLYASAKLRRSVRSADEQIAATLFLRCTSRLSRRRRMNSCALIRRSAALPWRPLKERPPAPPAPLGSPPAWRPWCSLCCTAFSICSAALKGSEAEDLTDGIGMRGLSPVDAAVAVDEDITCRAGCVGSARAVGGTDLAPRISSVSLSGGVPLSPFEAHRASRIAAYRILVHTVTATSLLSFDFHPCD